MSELINKIIERKFETLTTKKVTLFSEIKLIKLKLSPSKVFGNRY